jgi:processive 1,2-diacylglycerol beta-glucosyltransferase
LVWVVVNPIPGQEERNSDHLLEQGAAIKCNNLPTLTFKVDRLLDEPERLAAMRRNSLRIARPDASSVIAHKLLDLAQEPTPELFPPIPDERATPTVTEVTS